MLALREDGVVIGSVSGGCVEDDLIARLHDGRIPTDGPPVQLITYGVTREEAARFGLPCGGTLRLTEERVGDRTWVAQLLARCEAHEIVARSLDLETGEVVLKPGNKADLLTFDGQDLARHLWPALALVADRRGPVVSLCRRDGAAAGFRSADLRSAHRVRLWLGRAAWPLCLGHA
jgi:xanthine/CO dehydrogenase XdhC/CoxF family maturation factor